MLNRRNWVEKGQAVVLAALAMAPTCVLAQSDSGGSLGWLSTGYTQSWFHAAEAEGRVSGKVGVFELYAEGQAGLVFEQPGNPLVGFEVPQAYVSTSSSSPTQVHFGRKRSDWSKLDQQWQLGIWEPRFRWDILNPDPVGLAGIFVTHHSSDLQLTAMGSPGLIPERGAPMELRGDQWFSGSPFARTPPPRITVLGASARVSYDLQMPSYSELLFKPGASIRARLGKQKGLWGAIGYAFKPMNQVLLAYDGLYNMGPEQVEVDLYPRTAYHHLIGTEVGYQTRDLSLTLSYLLDRPVDEELGSQRTFQQTTLSNAISLTAEFKKIDLSASALVQVGGFAPDGGQDADGVSSAFESRYPFSTAVSVSKTTNFNDRFSLASRLIYDIGNVGLILSSHFAYRFDRSWRWTLGADFLASGTDPSSTAGNTGGLIGLYRGNDRIQAGVSYVF